MIGPPLTVPAGLEPFAGRGLLAACDVQVARRLGRLAGDETPEALLAVALVARAARLGHTLTDLRRVRDLTVVDADEPVDVAALPWPAPGPWGAALAASPLCGDGRPLRVDGSRVWFDRLWGEEDQVAGDLRDLARARGDVDVARLHDGVARLFGDERAGAQAQAAATAVLRGLAVVAGGPGTGKTTTVARIVALVAEQTRPGGRPPLVALAAPTGRAAARLEEAVHEAASQLAVEPWVAEALRRAKATTLHRLLGWRADSSTRFRHHRGDPLAHDLVVVDETSMVSLTLMARLCDAVRRDARLVLVGDPAQLASIEAGSVLADVVGPAAAAPRRSAAWLERLGDALGTTLDEPPSADREGFGDGVVVLAGSRRYGPAIGTVADAVRLGDADAAIDALRAGAGPVRWVEAGAQEEAALDAVREPVLTWGRAVHDAAARGDEDEALRALSTLRVLCAHRRGPAGVAAWTARIETWLRDALGLPPGDPTRVAGRPLLVTANDRALRLSNGDLGVVVHRPDGAVRAVFSRSAGEPVRLAPSRLDGVEAAYALTIHKAQGSQAAHALVVLPDAGSRLLTRELLYTAVTRAQDRLTVVGTEEVLREAVARPIERATGLEARLWDT